MRGEVAVKYIVFIIVLITLRLIGPVQSLVAWTATFEHLVYSAIVIMFALLFVAKTNEIVKAKSVRHVIKTIVIVFVAVFIYTIFQEKIIAATISLGILTAVLIYIFQTPLLSFIGWIYLRIGRVYQIGDRISIGSIKGDVISINPIRTNVLEVGGEYIKADLPSGRLFTFPNSLLLSEPVSNYTKYLSRIWVAVPFHLTYETDFDFAKKKIRIIVMKMLKKEIEDIKKHLKNIGGGKELVQFHIRPYQSWVELQVIFPVDPHKQSATLTSVTEDTLKMFNNYPKKIQFPIGRNR
jgi:small-conductance mechanosensitive channel